MSGAAWEYEAETIVEEQAAIAVVTNGGGAVEICQRLPNGGAVRVEIVGKLNLGLLVEKLSALHSSWEEGP